MAMADPVTVSNTKDGDLLPVKVDADAGKILITLPKADADGTMGRFLYSTAIRSGLGSAPIRIDRGMLGPTQICLPPHRQKGGGGLRKPRFRATGEAAVQNGAKTSFPSAPSPCSMWFHPTPKARWSISALPDPRHDAPCRCVESGSQGVPPVG
jgi:hypothetical protein